MTNVQLTFSPTQRKIHPRRALPSLKRAPPQRRSLAESVLARVQPKIPVQRRVRVVSLPRFDDFPTGIVEIASDLGEAVPESPLPGEGRQDDGGGVDGGERADEGSDGHEGPVVEVEG